MICISISKDTLLTHVLNALRIQYVQSQIIWVRPTPQTSQLQMLIPGWSSASLARATSLQVVVVAQSLDTQRMNDAHSQHYFPWSETRHVGWLVHQSCPGYLHIMLNNSRRKSAVYLPLMVCLDWHHIHHIRLFTSHPSQWKIKQLQ